MAGGYGAAGPVVKNAVTGEGSSLCGRDRPCGKRVDRRRVGAPVGVRFVRANRIAPAVFSVCVTTELVFGAGQANPPAFNLVEPGCCPRNGDPRRGEPLRPVFAMAGTRQFPSVREILRTG